ncbi:MAG: hypothetical protein HQK91_00185 [Nitrospirae bacterium]|nr:hypothetical protein [Nitrospirota bacterium]MBF0539854.1 hypothetical protein [Nitrospirota bacterium]
MIYSIIFLALAFILLYSANLNNILGYLLLWVAFDFIIISIGYLGAGHSIFQKNIYGKIPFYIKLIYLPYMLFSSLIWHLYKITINEKPYNKISNDIIIGRYLLKDEIPDGITNYIDLTAELEEPNNVLSMNYICLPILDGSIPSSKDLEIALSKMKHGITYIHCAQGHGRTGLIAIILLKTQNKITTFEEGLTLLKDFRPNIELNRNQKKFANQYFTT